MAEMAFNGRSTLTYYELDLVRCLFSTPKRKRNLVNVLGSDGEMDYMKGLGEPTYESRTLQAEFTILGKPKDVISRLFEELEGATVPIMLPDDPMWYVIGDVHVYQAVAQPGGAVVITANCQPWRLSVMTVNQVVPAQETETTVTWYNTGRRTVVPEISVTDADVTITSGETTRVLAEGTYLIPEFAIPGKGSISITVSGGAITAKYQEAIL